MQLDEPDANPDRIHITLDDANEDNAVFLIHEYACEDLEGWLAQCYLPPFEEVLEQWHLVPTLWPLLPQTAHP